MRSIGFDDALIGVVFAMFSGIILFAEIPTGILCCLLCVPLQTGMAQEYLTPSTEMSELPPIFRVGAHIPFTWWHGTQQPALWKLMKCVDSGCACIIWAQKLRVDLSAVDAGCVGPGRGLAAMIDDEDDDMFDTREITLHGAEGFAGMRKAGGACGQHSGRHGGCGCHWHHDG